MDKICSDHNNASSESPGSPPHVSHLVKFDTDTVNKPTTHDEVNLESNSTIECSETISKARPNDQVAAAHDDRSVVQDRPLNRIRKRKLGPAEKNPDQVLTHLLKARRRQLRHRD